MTKQKRKKLLFNQVGSAVKTASGNPVQENLERFRQQMQASANRAIQKNRLFQLDREKL